MIRIRTDSENKFPEMETLVNMEMKLDEADKIAETMGERLSHDDVF